MSFMDQLKEKFKDVKFGFEGVDLKIRKHPTESKLLAEVEIVGSVDLPGDTLEDMIAAGYTMATAGNSSEPGSSSPGSPGKP